MPRAGDRGRSSSLALLTLCMQIAVAAPSHAQDRAPGDVATAREQFNAGVTAAQAGRWPDAARAFDRSYRLVPQPLILINLAAAQVQSGQLVAGGESYRRFLREASAAETVSMGEAAQRALADVERRIGHLRVTVRELRNHDRVLLDGEELPPAALDVERPVDPGTHVVGVERGGSMARQEVVVAESAHRIVQLVAPRSMGDGPGLYVEALAPVTPNAPAASRPIVRSPWLWLVAGVVVVGAGVGVCAAAGCFEPVIAPGSAGVGRW